MVSEWRGINPSVVGSLNQDLKVESRGGREILELVRELRNFQTIYKDNSISLVKEIQAVTDENEKKYLSSILKKLEDKSLENKLMQAVERGAPLSDVQIGVLEKAFSDISKMFSKFDSMLSVSFSSLSDIVQSYLEESKENGEQQRVLMSQLLEQVKGQIAQQEELTNTQAEVFNKKDGSLEAQLENNTRLKELQTIQNNLSKAMKEQYSTVSLQYEAFNRVLKEVSSDSLNLRQYRVLQSIDKNISKKETIKVESKPKQKERKRVLNSGVRRTLRGAAFEMLGLDDFSDSLDFGDGVGDFLDWEGRGRTSGRRKRGLRLKSRARLAKRSMGRGVGRFFSGGKRLLGAGAKIVAPVGGVLGGVASLGQGVVGGLGSAVSSVGASLPKGASMAGKGLSSVLGFAAGAGKVGLNLAKAIPVAGQVLAVGASLYDGIKGFSDVDLHKKAFNLSDLEEASLGQKVSSAVANVVDLGGVFTGVANFFGSDIETKDIARAIYSVPQSIASGSIDFIEAGVRNVTGWVSDLFSGGEKALVETKTVLSNIKPMEVSSKILAEASDLMAFGVGGVTNWVSGLFSKVKLGLGALQDKGGLDLGFSGVLSTLTKKAFNFVSDILPKDLNKTLSLRQSGDLMGGSSSLLGFDGKVKGGLEPVNKDSINSRAAGVRIYDNSGTESEFLESFNKGTYKSFKMALGDQPIDLDEDSKTLFKNLIDTLTPIGEQLKATLSQGGFLGALGSVGGFVGNAVNSVSNFLGIGRSGGGRSSNNLPPQGAGLGALSARYESAGADSKAIGWDSKGGTSYGTYQIAAKTGTFDNWLSWLESSGHSEVAAQLRASGPADTGGKNGAMVETWQRLVEEGKITKDMEHQFIKTTHYDKAFSNIKSESLKTMIEKSDTLQDVLWSTAVQHGGNTSVFNEAYTEGMSEKELIDSVYHMRSQKFANNPYSSSANRRFAEERQVAHNMYLREMGAAMFPTSDGVPMITPEVVGVSGALQAATQNAIDNGVKYGFGSKSSFSGQIDCSGWVTEMNLSMMEALNQQSQDVVFSKEAKEVMKKAGSGGAAGIIKTLSEATGELITNEGLTPELVKEGTVIGMDTGDRGWDAGRWRGIDHVVQTYRDPKTGEMMVSESAGKAGVRSEKYSEWYSKWGDKANLYGSSVNKLADPIALSSLNKNVLGADVAKVENRGSEVSMIQGPAVMTATEKGFNDITPSVIEAKASSSSVPPPVIVINNNNTTTERTQTPPPAPPSLIAENLEIASMNLPLNQEIGS